LSIEEKTNDCENFEKGMIYMKGGRRKRKPCACAMFVKKSKVHILYHKELA
jgi:hypothetical protein